MNEPLISFTAFETEAQFQDRLATMAPEYQRWELLDRERALWLKDATERFVAALEGIARRL